MLRGGSYADFFGTGAMRCSVMPEVHNTGHESLFSCKSPNSYLSKPWEQDKSYAWCPGQWQHKLPLNPSRLYWCYVLSLQISHGKNWEVEKKAYYLLPGFKDLPSGLCAPWLQSVATKLGLCSRGLHELVNLACIICARMPQAQYLIWNQV